MISRLSNAVTTILIDLLDQNLYGLEHSDFDKWERTFENVNFSMKYSNFTTTHKRIQTFEKCIGHGVGEPRYHTFLDE